MIELTPHENELFTNVLHAVLYWNRAQRINISDAERDMTQRVYEQLLKQRVVK